MSDKHGVKHYLNIWVWLLGLFVLSLVAAMPEMLILTLVAAFVIAVVKAGMVCGWFMHLNTEKKYIWWLFFTCLAMMGLFFAAIYPDVGKMEGTNWVNTTDANIKPGGGNGKHHGDDESAEAASGHTDPHADVQVDDEAHKVDAKAEAIGEPAPHSD